MAWVDRKEGFFVHAVLGVLVRLCVRMCIHCACRVTFIMFLDLSCSYIVFIPREPRGRLQKLILDFVAF